MENYENRIVAFIDILGFKDLIKKSENNPYQINELLEITSVQDKFIRGTPVGKNRHAAAYVLREEVLQTI